MRIGLVSCQCKNGDVVFNLRQIERAMIEAQGKAELLCFGEAFLQGFDALCWDYEVDKEIAIEQGSETIVTLRKWTQTYGVALLTGYIEREEDGLYSSCIVIENGRVLHNYRRISKGWKEFEIADAHYREGDATGEFRFRDRVCMPVLCGDLWDFPERFKTDHQLIWPVWLCFSKEQWEREELSEYAKQAALAAPDAVMINPIDPESGNCGGAFRFQNGKVIERIPFGKEGILFTDI